MGVYLSEVLYQAQPELLVYYCPGCCQRHLIPLKPRQDQRWTWDGNVDKPSVTPSLVHRIGLDKVCHAYLTNGQLQFQSDSHHHLRGQTVDMWPVNMEDRYKMKIEESVFQPPN